MTSPFTGTDELEVTRQDGAKKYFLLHCFAVCGNASGDMTFDFCDRTKRDSISSPTSASPFYRECVKQLTRFLYGCCVYSSHKYVKHPRMLENHGIGLMFSPPERK
ncbi:hypothetical protein ANTQUA_LOCUS1478 [Anthophora quadrimaculata]